MAPFDCAELAHKVTSILLRYNTKLEGFLKQKRLKKFATCLHSANVITDDLHDKPVYTEIWEQFTSYLACLGEKQEFEKHCRAFLYALQAVGGPMKDVADQITDEWKEIKLFID